AGARPDVAAPPQHGGRRHRPSSGRLRAVRRRPPRVRHALTRERRAVAMRLPASWKPVLGVQLRQPYFHQLERFLAAERSEHDFYPPEADVFNAFKLTPFDRVKVLILGQDPYHGPGQAHGLAFSVPPGVKPPPSLRNILKELHDDIGCPKPKGGCLEPWA